jgi:hypothetical protein
MLQCRFPYDYLFEIFFYNISIVKYSIFWILRIYGYTPRFYKVSTFKLAKIHVLITLVTFQLIHWFPATWPTKLPNNTFPYTTTTQSAQIKRPKSGSSRVLHDASASTSLALEKRARKPNYLVWHIAYFLGKHIKYQTNMILIRVVHVALIGSNVTYFL